MGKVYFLFGVHNHQPVGNFDFVFHDAYRRCYLPFVEVLEKYPSVKWNLHITGPLYDWISTYQSQFIEKIKKMVKQGQIEIMSGGYYEPILPIISDEDKLSQINLMNEFIKKTFRQHPYGIWIAERVWEPYLARIINISGLKYTFLDDTHFRYAGINRKEFFGYYVTEDSLRSIGVFPISKTLRYKIPFSKAEEAVALLRSFQQEKDVLVTLFDDGEKFGLWPHTFEWVYTKGWLDKFLSLLVKNSDVIETVTAREAIERFAPEGLVYLPTASYEEMGEWVLEPDTYSLYTGLEEAIEKLPCHEELKNFLRGGFFRNFYRKYPRLNYMHKKMLLVSEKLHKSSVARKDKKIMKYLWMSQCNCGYWHGIFGGFYLGHIRAAIYENLIKAETYFDKRNGKSGLSLERRDFDFDGVAETIVKNGHLICSFSDRGGTLLELSFRDRIFNFLNTITRRPESYHAKIAGKEHKDTEGASIHDIIRTKDKDLDKYLIYDTYERLGLIDHLLAKELSMDDFNRGRGVVTLSDKMYSLHAKKSSRDVILKYSYYQDDLDFVKRIRLSSAPEVSVDYKFLQRDVLQYYNFGVELNLFFQSLESLRFNASGDSFEGVGERVLKDKSILHIYDGFKKVEFRFSFSKSDIFIMPLYSVSSSESGFEKVYQGITILFIRKNENEGFTLKFRINKKEEKDGRKKKK